MAIMLGLLLLAQASSIPRVVEQVDPMNDERSVYMVVGDRSANLALGCSEAGNPDSVRVVAHFPRYIGDATPGIILGGRELQYRFDQRAAETVFWYSHDHGVYAEAERTRPLPFFVQMKGSSSVRLRTFDGAGDAADISISYSDPTSLIEDVLSRCGFAPDGTKLKKQRK